MPTPKEAQNRKKAISCRNKKSYAKESSAQSRANHLYSKGLKLKPYHCDICGNWHVCKRDKQSVLADLFKQIEKERK